MRRRTFLAAAGGAALASGAGARGAQTPAESDISLSTPTGTIFGTLTLPATAPAPVVLIVAGSGPTDRNGNSSMLRTDTYRLLAEALATRAIGSVRYDKRGVGASSAAASAEKDLRFETYVGDAAGWLRQLRGDSRFTKIVLAGHSEGSLIGMLAVQKAPADAFASLEGAGRPAPVVLSEQLKPELSPELYAQADAIITQLQAGHPVAEMPSELTTLFRASVQPYLITECVDGEGRGSSTIPLSKSRASRNR
ncbi:MAG TPA: alpha/beta hydrolase [Candidatus Tumulicola sp.]|jgi:hypothetical protein